MTATTFCIARVAAHRTPSNGNEMTAWTSPPVTMFAVPTVSRMKPQKIPRCRIAAPGSLNIFVWTNAYWIEAGEAGRDVVERARARRRGRRRRPAGGGPSRGRTPARRPRTRRRPAGRTGTCSKNGNISATSLGQVAPLVVVVGDRDPRLAVAVPRRGAGVGRAAMAASGSAGPVERRAGAGGAVVERAGERLERVGERRLERRQRLERGARAAGHVDDEAPADHADDAARQVGHRRLRSAGGANRLGQAGHLVVDHRQRRLGRDVARREPRPAGADDERVVGRAVAQGTLDQQPLVRDRRRGRRGSRHAPGGRRARSRSRPARVPAATPSLIVSTSARAPDGSGPIDGKSDIGSGPQGFLRIRPATRSPGRRWPRTGASRRPSAGRCHSPLWPPDLETRWTERISTPRSTPLTMS